MLLVTEGVDDVQLRCDFRDLRQALLGECPDDDRVNPALEIARDVLDGLTIGVHHVSRDLDDVAAQLADANRKGDARAERRLLEQQPNVLAIERVPGGRLHALDALALDLGGQLQHLGEAIGIEIKNG